MYTWWFLITSKLEWTQIVNITFFFTKELNIQGDGEMCYSIQPDSVRDRHSKYSHGLFVIALWNLFLHANVLVDNCKGIFTAYDCTRVFGFRCKDTEWKGSEERERLR